MTFEEAVQTVDALLMSEALAAVIQCSRDPARLTTMERRAIEKVLNVALDKTESEANAEASPGALLPSEEYGGNEI